jgi:hypothetical protein
MASNESDNSGEGGKKGSRTRVVVLGVIGALLLLPGACGVIFTAFALTTPNDPYVGAVYMFSIPGIVAGVLGVWLLRWAIRTYRARADQSAPE